MLSWKDIQKLINHYWQDGQYLKVLGLFAILMVPVLLTLILILAFAVRLGLFGPVPSSADLEQIKNPVASEIYSRNGVLMGKYYQENRTNISYELFPGHLIDALVATEDARFFEHSGIDWRALFRVFFRTILMGDISGGGGSTITQQLAKNIFGRRELPFIGLPVNKMKEIFTARKLEGTYSKEEIIELYLNTIPFGHNFYGLEVASRRYFGKSAPRLKIEEAAVLVGMLKANTYYNPARHPERSLARRNTVLSQMSKYGYLATDITDSLQQLPLETEFTLENPATGRATHFRQLLKTEVEKRIDGQKKEDGSAYNLELDGLKIYTSLDAGMQEYAEYALEEHMIQLQNQFDKHWEGRNVWQKPAYWKEAVENTPHYKKLVAAGLSSEEIDQRLSNKRDMLVYTVRGPEKKYWSAKDSLAHYLRQLRAGFLVLHPENGEVLAWVGGTDYRFFQYDHVQARRQVGSLFKPILYYSAFRDDFAPCDYFQNTLATYVDHDDWAPRNADGEYGGWYSLKGALANSVNTVSASLILRHGMNKTISTARQLGWKGNLPKLPSIALGTVESSLMDLLPIYAGLSNGFGVPPLTFIRKITDRKGKVLFERPKTAAEDYQAVDSLAALKIRAAMENVADVGTATRLRWKYDLRMPVAAKTGTTQSGADGWFVGCTPAVVAGAWVGGEYPWIRFRNSSFGQGAHMALPIWAKFYRRLAVSNKYGRVKGLNFDYPDSFYLHHLDCPIFLSDSAYQKRLLMEQKESDSEEGLLDQLIDVFRKEREKTEKSERSKEIERNNDKLKKRRKRKEKRKEFFDDLFGRDK
ncbi:MAG TPA: transglycosylase domain-containing protein [Saprospiraceae bacterium]|nr:transglycosylase domain-containing protein [Saprospiraceae bacterium]